MLRIVENRNQLHFHLFLTTYFLNIRDIIQTHIQKMTMHYLLSLISDCSPCNQGATRVAICKRSHHALLVVNHKKDQRLRHFKRVDTCKSLKECDVLGYNVTGFHTLNCLYDYLPTKRTLDGMFTTRSAKNTVFSNSSC